ncbi:DUF6079 family protein [Chloroflexota bacterium]
MTKIKDLISFEKIKEVIDIDAITDKKGMVEKYVISPALEDYLLHLLEDLNSSEHKAAQIIGGYGSGKSHLLAFIISILTDEKLRTYIQSEKVKAASEKINRDFCVVFWELQPNDVSLSEYFYDNIETQLAEKYGIELKVQTSGAIDHKKNIQSILDKIKQGNPTRGLVVVTDEISDFLKQKTKESINRDVQFLRVLGQTAQACDFTFIGAMQEHIFSNPKYVDEAESFGRVAERFQVITIKREDIKRVISKRVLHKTSEQRIELETLFKEYVKYFPTISAKLEDYIDLFPLHPYVVDIFSELPYFEKRGVIQFTIQEVEKILDNDFPHLITYDLIFDEIASKHTVKNLETVSPIVEAIQTLESKIDLLDTRHQRTARSIMKSLAVLKLYGKTNNNGANIEELANTLLILPDNKKMEATDEISIILNNLRKVTDGQFINHNKEGYYFLDLSIVVDYDQVIRRRADNLPENALNDEILSILKDQLLLTESSIHTIFLDSCKWQSRRSFKEGSFIYDIGKGKVTEMIGEYQIIFLSPFCDQSEYKSSENVLIITGKLSPEAFEELKKTAAAEALINDNYSRSVMEKKYVTLKRSFTDMFVKSYLDTGQIDTGTEKKSIKSLISREFSNFDELFSEIKPALLDYYFNKRYPKHPKFAQAITSDNIHGEFSSAIKEVVIKTGTQSMFSTARQLLNAFNLVDESGNLSTGNSEVAKKIVDVAKKSEGKNVDVKDIITMFETTPYGYHQLMTDFILSVLTFNGEIALKAAGGKTITSSEMEEVFKSGLNAFENIKYVVIEGDFDIQPIINLFNVLQLNPARLRVSSKRGEAVQEFRAKYLEIREQVDFVQNKLENMSLFESGTVDIEGLKKKHDILDTIPLSDFENIKTPNDLKKIIYDASTIKQIGDAYETLKQLGTFYKIYSEKVAKEIEYIKEIRRIVEDYPSIFQIEGLQDMIDDSFSVLSNVNKLLSLEELNPLIGKFQQIRKKYVAEYYKAHEKYVGSKVEWSKLSELASTSTYNNLKILKNVSILNRHSFIKTESEIIALMNLQCNDFRVDVLEQKVTCPKCGFPNSSASQNINKRIEEIDTEIADIFKGWEASILSELSNYKSNLQYLSAEEKNMVESIIKNGKLPEVITEDMVVALNNLFKELESIEITADDFFEKLFRGAQVMDYFTFERKLNALKQELVAGKDLDKVRIKFVEKGEE